MPDVEVSVDAPAPAVAPASPAPAAVDAQTVRDATTALHEAQDAQEAAEEARWDAESARAAIDGLASQLAAHEERLEDVEIVQAGVVAYLAEEEAAEPEPQRTEVERRDGADPKDRPADREQAEPDSPGCGSLW